MSPELESFRRFVDQQIEGGHADRSPEEMVELWRQQQELSESVAAVREALADMEAGDPGQPLAELVQRFRR